MATEAHVPVALLFQTDELGRHLRNVLQDLGTPIVYESTTHAIDRGSLEQSGARVVVVNLDSEIDGDLDRVYELLGSGPYRVLINEGHVSSRLSGWDQARWVRHLAAKILDAPEATDPPRPAGAEPVPGPAAHAVQDLRIDIAPAAGGDPSPAEAPDDAPLPEPTAWTDASSGIADTALLTEAPVSPPPADLPQQLEASALDEPFLFEDLPAIADAAAEEERLDVFPSPEGYEDDATAETGTVDAAGEASPFSDEDAQLLADFTLDGFDDTPASPVAPRQEDAAVDLDDWLSRAMADETAGTIERPVLDEDDAEADSAPLAHLDTQPVYSDSFQAEAGVPGTDTAELPAVPDWDLVSFEVDDEVATAAPFGIEKISAAEYMSAASPYPPAAPEAESAEEASTLELVPMEDAIAPQAARVDHEVWLDADALALSAKAARPADANAAIRRVVALCASIGGPEAIREVIGAIPRDYPALFVLVQHMGEEFIDLLAQQLARATELTIRVPGHGERVAHGDLLIVPPHRDLRIKADGTVLVQPQTVPTSHHPSIDQMLAVLAADFGADALAVVFSGMSGDGVAGCRALAEAGGEIWVQDPATCVVSEMVDSVNDAGLAGFQGSPTALAEHLAALRDADPAPAQ
ncbi:chemotaxis protein CheB [Dokdonella koreensis]|uniref:protein-glutamate methylesterase n=1 Tax=Dokdonella koreensis DS-123 TaxID=1300342 RepID=A0A160DRM5_9GAMM|nr:chemotaxis protein CheB [Dokdonella koreensis]ANB16827.1 Chemotaxis response regulator protein-glutamate methylesterase CheB [Dokdonella koreensis DS-123]